MPAAPFAIPADVQALRLALPELLGEPPESQDRLDRVMGLHRIVGEDRIVRQRHEPGRELS